MGCGCRGKKNTAAVAKATIPNATFEVWKNDRTTGRKFTSLISAQSYARSVGGEVREVA